MKECSFLAAFFKALSPTFSIFIILSIKVQINMVK